MAFTVGGKRALIDYVTQAAELGGEPKKFHIPNAIKLTEKQRTDLQTVLSEYWKRPYDCPHTLAIKPQHGFKSRVIKDNYPVMQYAEWLEVGCSDLAYVSTEIATGRPRLVHGPFVDFVPHTYSLVVPIQSDSHGTVHVADVIPSGLPAGAKK
jgi:hypothetical protein